jgi:hypothetical protein
MTECCLATAKNHNSSRQFPRRHRPGGRVRILGHVDSLNDVLIPQFRKTFLLGDFASSFVQFATFIGYFVFAIPAALFMRRFGYRAAVVMGLVLFGTGALLFYPAAQFGEYHFFLGAVRGGKRPVVSRDFGQSHDRGHGASENADQRRNFAQAFNPLGCDFRRVHRQGTDPLRSSPDGQQSTGLDTAAR